MGRQPLKSANASRKPRCAGVNTADGPALGAGGLPAGQPVPTAFHASPASTLTPMTAEPQRKATRMCSRNCPSRRSKREEHLNSLPPLSRATPGNRASRGGGGRGGPRETSLLGEITSSGGWEKRQKRRGTTRGPAAARR